MKLLITGGSGMVGRNLLENTKIQENEVLSPKSSELNLLDIDSVKSYLDKNKPDVIIHCAGRVGGIQANIKNPVSFLVENMDMGRNLVIAARDAKIKKLINLGSSCMYPREASNPLNEDLILKGELEPTNEGYALAKIVVARLCEYISKEDSSYQYKTIIPCNLFGSYDKFDPENSHMIPAVIRKIHEAKLNKESRVEIWGDGKARREFMLASELADFISFALENFEKVPNYLNVGLGYDYSINEYYEAIASIIGWNGEFFHNLDRPVGMKQKVVDIQRLTDLGWKSKVSLKLGVTKTYEFFMENYGN
ncbi:GDP-L-fucose synthase [Halobacteriovorax sp. JY17]|uniref:GDP-L-fucose synthase family protein n=1 Tax=Halobacteriovorax sp. JY17 TaxID=2014617 RepID=UPI000C4F1266|nr:GDP-L-fucose synthase [Halobacteriovorax sp. JY17]PIK14707.1 MAG: GDP-fucose synthetase [Halobacteriovorax sp. JY17]